MTLELPAADAEPRLKHFPVSLFAVTMGLCGITLATQKLAHTIGGFGFAADALLALSMAVFCVIAAFYAAKAVRYPADVVAEWSHPVRISFFPAISISLILIGSALIGHSAQAATVLWGLGAALHLAGTLSVVSAWIGHRSFDALFLNPAWFIPAVGNILVPVAGVRLGFPEISWFFFSVGIVFWIVLLTLVFNRLIFHNPLPARLMPTLVILIAPPALGLISYQQLAPGLDPFSRLLYYAAVLFFLVIVSQAPKLVRLPYALSWWAYSFPLAAFTIATLLYGELTGSPAHRLAGFALYGLLVFVVAVLVMTTLRAIARGEICRPEA